MSKPEGWDQLQRDHPELVLFMQQMGEAFGKLKGAAVKEKGGRLIFRVGQFDQAKNLKFVSQYKRFKRYKNEKG